MGEFALGVVIVHLAAKGHRFLVLSVTAGAHHGRGHGRDGHDDREDFY